MTLLLAPFKKGRITYAPVAKTIFLGDSLIGYREAAFEVPTHELAHHLVEQQYTRDGALPDVRRLVRALIGREQQLLLTGVSESGSHEGQISVPESGASLDVVGFKTDSRISWVWAQLPMLDGDGFAVIERAPATLTTTVSVEGWKPFGSTGVTSLSSSIRTWWPTTRTCSTVALPMSVECFSGMTRASRICCIDSVRSRMR
jgi:hypothetical protein